MNSIVVFSDTHGIDIPEKLINIINENKYVFFLGDGITHLGNILLHKGFYGVNGNCDPHIFKDEEIIEIDGIKILITHGHTHHVKEDLIGLKYRAEELGCKYVFYGHTHYAQVIEDNNITFICPGSLAYPYIGKPTYAYCVINNGKLISQIVDL